MASPVPRPVLRVPNRDWLQGIVVKGVVPGWLLSVVFHGIMLATLMTVTQIPSCRGDYSGENGTGFREIGIREREGGGGGSTGDGEPGEGDGTSEVLTSLPTDAISPPAISNSPPVPLSLPQSNIPQTGAAPPVLGIGPPPVVGVASGQMNSAVGTSNSNLTGGGGGGSGVPGSRGQGGGGGRGKGGGQTSLFGVNDAGKTFVYVIDRSASMEDHAAFRAAKAELLTSLSRLTEVQQFQVIFYNNAPMTWTPRSGRFRMFFGTDAQRLEVSELIGAIDPVGGTDHMPALKAALEYNPDVLFLLTDGASSELTAAELKEIQRLNRRGTHIHCIEFGTSPPLSLADSQAAPNFLMKLAKQNSGQHTYRDVKTLGGK